MIGGQRSHSPSGEEIGTHDAFSDARGQRAVDNAGGQTVSGIGSNRSDESPTAIDSHPKVALLFHPEEVIEAGLEFFRFTN